MKMLRFLVKMLRFLLKKLRISVKMLGILVQILGFAVRVLRFRVKRIRDLVKMLEFLVKMLRFLVNKLRFLVKMLRFPDRFRFQLKTLIESLACKQRVMFVHHTSWHRLKIQNKPLRPTTSQNGCGTSMIETYRFEHTPTSYAGDRGFSSFQSLLRLHV